MISHPSSMPVMPDPYPAHQQSSGRGLWMVLLIVVLLGAGAVFFVINKNKVGSVVVTVAGPGNKPVDGIEIYVDGKRANCRGVSPCRVEALPPGTHIIKASAAGYAAAADTAIKIAPGEESVHNAVLASPSEGTGIKVSHEGRGLKLFIDDKEIGPLPQERGDLSPGEHKIRIEGERYEPFEQTVTVTADNITPVEAKLKVKKGLVTIKLGENADGANVTLVSGDERRPIPADRFKDKVLAVELEASKAYSIVAEKKGFAPYEKKIDFDDGQAEKTFTVNLMLPSADRGDRGDRGGDREPSPPPVRHGGGGGTPTPKPTPAVTTPAPAAAAGNATLNFVSDPPSNIVLDGRPLGKTPKSASVPAGNHTVLFIHPEFGRKAKSIPVAAGKNATVKVKFP
jgi:serine/threonine-protein kinase